MPYALAKLLKSFIIFGLSFYDVNRTSFERYTETNGVICYVCTTLYGVTMCVPSVLVYFEMCLVFIMHNMCFNAKTIFGTTIEMQCYIMR